MSDRFPPRPAFASRHWLVWWHLAAAATGFCQLLLQSDLLYVVICQLALALLPWVYRTLDQGGGIAALVFVATFAKLFVVSQWVKLGFLQAADTNLESPVETVLVLLLSILAFWIAGAAARPLTEGRGGLASVPQDPAFLLRVAIVAAALCLLSINLRYGAGLSRVGEAEYTEGEGLVVVFYLGQLLPLAVAALTARAYILSGGRRYVDVLVVLAILAGMVQGLWENQRWIMMAGVVSFAATYFAYGGRLRPRHLAAAGAAALVMHFVAFPLVDLQRGFRRDITASEYASETAQTALELLDAERGAGYRAQLNESYLSWDTRLYYGDPTGFFDRFSPSPLDETVTYIDLAGPFGLAQLVEQVTYGIPNVFLRLVGIERPVRGGQTLELAIHGQNTNMNYGVMAEVYSTVGLPLFLPVLSVIGFVYILMLHIVYGRFRNNYFAAFGFSTLYFNFAVSDLGDVIPQLTIQGTLNIIILTVIAVACGRIGPLRPRPAPLHGAPARRRPAPAD